MSCDQKSYGKDTPQVEKFRDFMLSRVHTARLLVKTGLLDPPRTTELLLVWK